MDRLSKTKTIFCLFQNPHQYRKEMNLIVLLAIRAVLNQRQFVMLIISPSFPQKTERLKMIKANKSRKLIDSRVVL